MKIIPLSEGSFTIDHTKVFVPFNKSADDLQERARGSLLVEIQPFVVVTEKDVLLLDTGLGFTNANGEMQLHQNMRDNNIDPASVTKVLLSHLHKDHAGGISRINPSTGHTTLSFPAATYFVNKKEFHTAVENKTASYIPQDFMILGRSANTVLLDDEGTLDGYIHYDASGAHSPHHQTFMIEENGEKVFFGGDVAPQLQQMKNRFIAKYDFDGKKAMELRQAWWEEGKRDGRTFLFYHDIKTPFFRN